MVKMRVRAHRDDDLKPTKVEIWKERKKVTVTYQYSPVGDVYDFTIEGRRELLPSVPELLQIVDAKRLDRIGTIEKINVVDELTLLKVLEELTLLKTIQTIQNVEHATIDEITTIRDVTWSPKSLIQNPFFEAEGTGWRQLETVEFGVSVGVAYVKFSANLQGVIGQKFAIPLDPSWWTSLLLRAGSGTVGSKLRIAYSYTDGSDDAEEITKTSVNPEFLTLSPSNKKIYDLQIQHLVTYPHDFRAHAILTVF